MAGVTNRGKFLFGDLFLRGQNAPTVLYVALCTATTTPTADTNILNQLDEIPAGNGYTSGGRSVARNTTDWDVATEWDTTDWAFFQMKDITWTASGGNLPSSGNGARWKVLTTDETTVTSRQVIAYFSLGSQRTVSDGQPITIQDSEVRIKES